MQISFIKSTNSRKSLPAHKHARSGYSFTFSRAQGLRDVGGYLLNGCTQFPCDQKPLLCLNGVVRVEESAADDSTLRLCMKHTNHCFKPIIMDYGVVIQKQEQVAIGRGSSPVIAFCKSQILRTPDDLTFYPDRNSQFPVRRSVVKENNLIIRIRSVSLYRAMQFLE